MNLHEYQAKKLLKEHGIKIPLGYVCSTLSEIKNISSKIATNSVVLKCQVHAGGRGKAGGVRVVNNIEEIYTFFQTWIGKRLVTNQTNIHGQPIDKILIEETIDINKEFYLSVLIDRAIAKITVIASNAGGMEFEEIAKKNIGVIHKIVIDPVTGPQLYQGRELAFKLGFINHQIDDFTKIFIKLIYIYQKYDLDLIEINPLVLTKQNELICLDSKLIVDNNSLFRQSEMMKMHDLKQEDLLESHAIKFGLNYISLHGNIGCMVNGAGLAMATMDLIKYYGGEPANFLDIGGNITKEKIVEGLKIILSDKKVQVVLVNIFGGIVRCDLVAEGIIETSLLLNIKVPIIVRLEGNNAKLGIQKLTDSKLNIVLTTDLVYAANNAIKVTKEKGA
ncbi:MAG: ADP-forming succinate--CoA ligase subunit beta [Pantoea sp. Brub]|nr:ADP-forming succinate--CoA ligase subunit beta [Pantoea sp. Brub]